MPDGVSPANADPVHLAKNPRQRSRPRRALRSTRSNRTLGGSSREGAPGRCGVSATMHSPHRVACRSRWPPVINETLAECESELIPDLGNYKPKLLPEKRPNGKRGCDKNRNRGEGRNGRGAGVPRPGAAPAPLSADHRGRHQPDPASRAEPNGPRG